MRFFFKAILILYTISFCFNSFSQTQIQQKIDSLKSLSLKENDFNKIAIYDKLYEYYRGLNLDSAEYFAKESYKFSLKSNNKKSIGNSLVILGIMYSDRALQNKAIPNLKEALKIGLDLNDSLLISKSYRALGSLYSNLGNFNLSIQYILKALPIDEKLNTQLEIAKTYVELAINLHRSKKFNEAYIYNNKALKIYREQKNKLRVGISYNNLSNNLNGLTQYKESIKYSEKAVKIFDSLGYKRFTAYPLGNMAIAYDSIKNYTLAKNLYKQSIQIHFKNKEYYELGFLQNGLANLYLKQGLIDKAIITAKKALKNSQKVNALEFETYSSKTLSKSYNRQKNYKKAAFFSNQYAVLKDSLFKTEERKTQLELKEQYETTKKEKEIAQQKEELLEKELAIKNRNLYAALLGGALLLLAVISFGYYRRNLFKRKQLQKELELKDALATIKTQNRLQEQRLRISRDLHDNIGSQLTFIISTIDNLKFISKDANDKLKDKLANISSFTSDTIFQLRDTIWAMNKNEISIEDIHTRILTYIEKAKTAKPDIKFTIKFTIDNSRTLTSIQGMNIFRVIQEAINNAIKYSNASAITINATETKNQIQFKVSDNGKGFDLTKVTLGNGLSNMEKRMSEIDGQVFINSKPSKGTDIQIICNL